MNIIHKVTWKSMWKNRTRTLVTIFSVVLSAAMFMAVVTMVYSLWDYLVRSSINEFGDVYVQFDYASDNQAERLAGENAIRNMSDVEVLGYRDFYDFADESLTFGIFRLSAVDNSFFEMMTIPLIEGRLPQNSAEIVLPEDYNDRLTGEGHPAVALGEKITIKLRTKLSFEEGYEVLESVLSKEFEREYTVVGIIENKSFTADREASPIYAMLTIADGNEGDALWHRLYVKTDRPSQVKNLPGVSYGEDVFLYDDLLSLYGVGGGAELSVLLVLAAALIAVIILASVNPISNAFSISVSERTMQFGLLTGIGGTKRQISKSVYVEAGVIAGIGILPGLLMGYGITAILLNRYGKKITELYEYLFSGRTGSVAFYAVPSVIIALLAALICTATIMAAARRPAKRAAKYTPIEAIRQSRDIYVRPKTLRVRKLFSRIFGVPGMLARKYYKVSRRKYRVTVTALSFSLVLFIAVNYLGNTLDLILSSYEMENYDFLCHVRDEKQVEAGMDFLKNAPGVTTAKLIYKSIGTNKVSILNEEFSDGYREILRWEGNLELPEDKQELPDGETSTRKAKIIYLEDAHFEEVLRGEGIDPAPYLVGEDPLAVTVKTTVESDVYPDEDGNATTSAYEGAWLKEGASVYLYDHYLTIPDQLREESWADKEPLIVRGVTTKGETTLDAMVEIQGKDGKVNLVTVMTVLIEFVTDAESGKLSCKYYAYDKEARERGDLLLHLEDESAVICVGASLENRPFGVHSGEEETALILPLSKLSEDENDIYRSYFMVKSEDYTKTDAALVAYLEESEVFGYEGLYSDNQYLRLMVSVSLIRFIMSGVLILIALICASNVFNTITANIALRSRDFGMLRSMGMTNGQMNRMMFTESISYIATALFISLCMGALVCGAVYFVALSYLGRGVGVPWEMAVIGVAAVVLLVFASTFYAAGKLRKESPIDAIRTENI